MVEVVVPRRAYAITRCVPDIGASWPLVPDCANCERPNRVREVKFDDLSPGVQYWRCEGCGFVWATRDGDDLRSLGQQTPRESA
jgi:transposase-like protein